MFVLWKIFVCLIINNNKRSFIKMKIIVYNHFRKKKNIFMLLEFLKFFGLLKCDLQDILYVDNFLCKTASLIYIFLQIGCFILRNTGKF